MNINFYQLPEFVAYGILFCLSLALIRQQKQEPRMKYWLYGWLLILIHASIFMLFPPIFPFTEMARGTLFLAGQMFILAAYLHGPASILSSDLLRHMSLPATINVLFMVASQAYSESQPSEQQLSLFYLLILLGAICTVRIALNDNKTRSWHAALSIILTLIVYTLQATALHFYGLVIASQWLMCWTYLAVAFFFLRHSPTLTIGIIATSFSFILWGLVFPVYELFNNLAPDISGKIDPDVWNLPKFLAAASFILVLLEEQVTDAIQLANHDELTGLANRRLYTDHFGQAVARATRNRSEFGLMVIDLNGFKKINDTLGHEAGDTVLKTVSTRFLAVLRSTDTLARTGGDEFTLILESVNNTPDAKKISRKLEEVLEVPILLANGITYQVKASFGFAIYPQDGTTQTLLQAVADARMYLCKEQCHNE
ncbi:GGDEF domain-containing protein [Serratia proteamaculans]|uniref:GGDEF domain-containing protein n=1 Tax=Serratia proteamaculans TaxID=28151 RepID=UPI001075D2C6|nr:GGDEF domain-containing protein [Serratia proteamaculans]TFZ48803.1 GGDEF domain-containing protein [Serratia proteamaculans]